MKFVVILMIISSLQLSAKVYSQSERFTFSMHNAQFKQVINKIRKGSSYDFIYRDKDIASVPAININVNNATLTEVLDKCVANTNIKYSVDGTIILFSKIVKKPDNKEIKGTVKDEKGNPLPGVTVLIKGTSVGVSTNVKGEFTIKGKKGDMLVISFIGMETKEVKYQGKSLNVKLKEQAANLDEVVVTGYQVIEKRKLTSSVYSVKGKDVVESVGTSIDKMLQGKIPGMTIMQQSSTPGAAPKIRIRGSSSITGNREPVWVVDGIVLQDPVKIETSDLNSLDKVNLIGNAISFLNPQDIERIDVLKDASATAIYGVKAANGVIVITTKKGKRGKPRFSYSTSVNVIQRPNYDKAFLMNSQERIDVSREMHQKGLEFSSVMPSLVGYEGALMDLWKRNISYDEFGQLVQKYSNLNTDWFDLLFRNSISQNHNFSLSGGSEKTTYYFSAGYNNQKGSTIGVDYNQLTARLNLTSKLKENVTLGLGLSIGSTTNERPHTSIDMLQYAYNTSRAIPAYNEDGTPFFYAVRNGYRHEPSAYFSPALKYNIFNEIDNSGNTIKNKNFGLNLNLNWKINKWINYNLVAGASASNSFDENWFGPETYMAQDKRGLAFGVKDPADREQCDEFYRYNKLPKGGEIYTSDVNSSSFTLRNSVRFNRHFGLHGITANVGTEMSISKSYGRTRTNYGYLPSRGKSFAIIDLDKYSDYKDIIKNNKTAISESENRYLSFYGTLSYSYNSKYIVNFNIRTDGSNNFGQDKKNRFLPIWSVSGRWNVAREKWFENQNILNQFSVRASYGIQGNVSPDQVPNLILTIAPTDAFSNEYASKLYKVPNNKLRWEKTQSYNFGIDFSFLNDRVHGGIEVYRKYGKDQIVSKQITSTNGAESVSLNAGNLENKGWELYVGTTLVKSKDFSWRVSVNTGKNKNKVTKVGDNVSQDYTYVNYLNGSFVKNGMSVHSFYSYMYDKLDNTGMPTFKNFNERDKDGNLLVSSYDEAYARIMTFSGKRMPDLTGGCSTSITYKNFLLSAQFSFSFGSQIRLNDLYDTYQMLPYPQQNMSSDFVNRWRKPGDEKFTNIPGLSNSSLQLRGREYEVAKTRWEMYNNSDLRVVNNNYMRCRNLSLSYDLPKDILKDINGVRLSFSASNLFVIKNKGLHGRDPEQLKMGSTVLPPQKTYSFSLTANF